MKLDRWIKMALVCGAIVMLAACSSHRGGNRSDIDAANAAYGAESSGLGDESGFGDAGPTGSRELRQRTYYFDYDSNVVREEDKPAIYANANYLASHPGVKIMLEGHTDPRGSREYNIGLGERRAKAVASLLLARGVSTSQISVVSYGAEKLASSGHSESEFQQDRRVVLVYMRR